MEKPEFLDRVWHDMSSVHKDKSLAAACLFMQEQFDVDVPLLLLLCLGDQHQGAPGQHDLVTYVEQSALWRQSVIVPIRTVRQTMKTTFVALAELALREQIKQVELEAERLHVARLVETYPPLTKQEPPAAPSYLHLCQVPQTDARHFLATFHHAFDSQIGRRQSATMKAEK